MRLSHGTERGSPKAANRVPLSCSQSHNPSPVFVRPKARTPFANDSTLPSRPRRLFAPLPGKHSFRPNVCDEASLLPELRPPGHLLEISAASPCFYKDTIYGNEEVECGLILYKGRRRPSEDLQRVPLNRSALCGTADAELRKMLSDALVSAVPRRKKLCASAQCGELPPSGKHTAHHVWRPHIRTELVRLGKGNQTCKNQPSAPVEVRAVDSPLNDPRLVTFSRLSDAFAGTEFARQDRGPAEVSHKRRASLGVEARPAVQFADAVRE